MILFCAHAKNRGDTPLLIESRTVRELGSRKKNEVKDTNKIILFSDILGRRNRNVRTYFVRFVLFLRVFLPS
jgi:hypothetical protein